MNLEEIRKEINAYERIRDKVLKEIDKDISKTASNRLKLEVAAITITLDSLYEKLEIAIKIDNIQRIEND